MPVETNTTVKIRNGENIGETTMGLNRHSKLSEGLLIIQFDVSMSDYRLIGFVLLYVYHVTL